MKAKKHLGQHFLVNKGVVEKIVNAVDSLGKERSLVEIGCGYGALTESLLNSGRELTGVELDNDCVLVLNDKYQDKPFQLIENDFLNVTEKDLLATGIKAPYVVCGNLPYNVGTEIIFRLLENFPGAESFCFMLQREVVEKMLAQPNDKNYGIPTVIFSWVTEMLGHFWVSPGSFNPPPKVDSGVVWFKRLAEPDFDPFAEKDLYVKQTH